MRSIDTVAVLGAGVIGASWTALFLAAGKNVRVFDIAENMEASVKDYVEKAWPTLGELGLVKSKGNLSFYNTPEDAVKGAGFVQENVPERLPIKHAIYQAIEPHLEPDCVVATSASGLMIKDLQDGWKNPSRFILGHPFNPPHLIPLVELLANDKTADDVLEIAEAFYKEVGKVTIRVNKEVPAHVANRLQAALWREALYLIESGVASVEDVDKAVWAGPGLRWAAMGPNMLFNLGAGEGGIEEFCNRYTDSFHTWWDSMGDARLSPELAKQLASGLENSANGQSLDDLSTERNRKIVGILKATSRKT